MAVLLAALSLLAPAPPGNLLLRESTPGHSLMIRALRPEATIWFHQFRGAHPFVRAWGQSLAGARHFARLARMSLRAMRWPDGTGPNWQNHRFSGAAFVVELPRGALKPPMRERLSKAIVRMGRWVRED